MKDKELERISTEEMEQISGGDEIDALRGLGEQIASWIRHLMNDDE